MLRCVDNRPMPTTTPDLPPADDEDPPRSPRGIQSVEVGGQLLKVLARNVMGIALFLV